jgi:hypothetical protein
MKHFSSLSLLALGIGTVQVAGFSTECSGLSLNNGWLIGTCLSNAGTAIQSSVVLPGWLANNDGELEVCNSFLMRH